jgi:hypothetical protein
VAISGRISPRTASAIATTAYIVSRWCNAKAKYASDRGPPRVAGAVHPQLSKGGPLEKMANRTAPKSRAGRSSVGQEHRCRIRTPRPF